MARRWWVVMVVGAMGCGSQADSTAEAAPESSAGAAPENASKCPSSPAPEAGDVLDGDLTIASAADAEGAEGVSELTGSLLIAPSFAGVLYLPDLQRVGGDVHLEGDAVAGAPEGQWAGITELRLPNLQSIGGELFLYRTGALVETDFRRLETTGSRVYYMRNLALRRIGLDSITHGPVEIYASPLAARCEIDAICARIGATSCGSEYSDANCSCQERCERLEPSCD